MAVFEDLEAIVSLLDYEIANNFAHFGNSPSKAGEIRCAIESQDQYPIAVAEVQGAFAGFARFSRYKEREAYDKTAEIGVYVHPNMRSLGVGSGLYRSILSWGRSSGLRTVIAGIALPNPASVRLHENFGFEHCGTLYKVGFKFDRWIDVGLWTLHWVDATQKVSS